MSDYDEIDEELARKFLEDPDNVNLSEATKITDEAAEILGTFDGFFWIEADGLKNLTATAAEHLLRVKARTHTQRASRDDDQNNLTFNGTTSKR